MPCAKPVTINGFVVALTMVPEPGEKPVGPYSISQEVSEDPSFLNNPFPFDVTNKRWLLDSDEVGRQKAREFLEAGEEVFLWGKFIKECELPERTKWDLNDVVNYVRETGKKIKRLDNYFSSDKWDIIDI